MHLSEPTREQSRIEERLDATRLLPLIERRLPDCRGRLELEGCRVINIQLRPGEQCLGHYELTFRERDTGEEVSQTVFVSLIDVAPRPTIEPRNYHDLGLPIRTPETEIPELAAVMYPAVLDPGLPGLIQALDREAMKDLLKPVTQVGDSSVKGVRTRLISHTPGARATIRYRLYGGDSSGPGERQTAVIGKLNAHRELGSIMADYQALWQCTSDAFRQAKPLGTIQSLGLSLQTMLEGERLNAFIGSPEFPGMLQSIGVALAALHQAPLPVERIRDPKREINSFTNRSHLLGAVLPDPTQLERLVARLTDAVAAHCNVSGIVHGDFHHANVMASDAGIALIDFDEMGLGDPALDAGRFTISLSVPSLRAYGDLRLLDVGREHFLNTYLNRTGTDIRRIRIFEAAAFIISALTLWRLSRSGWEHHVPGLIDLAEAALDEALRRPPPRAPGAGAPALTFDQSRRWAIDPAYLQQLMKAAVYRHHGAELHETEVAVSGQSDQETSLTCRMRGTTAAGRWSGKARGVCSPGLRTRAIGRMLDHLRAAPEQHPDAFGLPNLIGMNQRLGLLLWEAMDEQHPLLADEGDAQAVAVRLGLALSRLHACGYEPAGQESVADFLARRKLPAAEETGLDPADRLVPSFIAPRLAHFGVLGPRIVVRRPDKLALAPALLAVAEIERDLMRKSAPEAAACFRAAYLGATGRETRELDVWSKLRAGRRSSSAKK